jgi:hypothetical protein
MRSNGTANMLEFNLTQRERQLLIHLCTLSGQSKADFDAEIADLATAGPGAELVRLRFAPKGPAMELTKLDLRVLKDEGFIHFHWNLPDSGTGRLTSHALAAVESNFHGRPDSARAASAANDARAAIADGKAIALRFEKITTELVDLARDLIDADESLVARQEARSIADELSKPAPDEAIITRKIKRFVTRLALTFSSTADLALKGEKIGQFGERLAAWLVALSLWTEWHAANHPPTTPAPSKSPPASSAR